MPADLSVMRSAGVPSPFEAGTHDDRDLPAPAVGAGDPDAAPDLALKHGSELDRARLAIFGTGTFPAQPALTLDGDPFEVGDAAPGWLTTVARMIRPLCVGALMAIPTVGAMSVGIIAAFDPARGLAVAAATTAFLRGIPVEITLLIGTLATGYGFARTFEKLKKGNG